MVEVLPIVDEDVFRESVKKVMSELGLSYERLARGLSVYEEDLFLNQSQVYKLLNGSRGINLDEAHAIIEYLLQYRSIVPSDSKAGDFGEGDIESVFDSEKLSMIAELMRKNGFSQVPVYNKETGKFLGVVTELSIINRMHNPHTNNGHITNVGEFSEMTVRDAEIIEEIPKISTEIPLNKISQTLVHYPAIMLEKDGEICKIITRADLLKLIK